MPEAESSSGRKPGRSKPLAIDDREFMPGESGVVGVNVGTLPSGNAIFISIYVFRSKKPGPTVLLLGGLHGDEITGVEIVRRTLENRLFTKLVAGSVVAIPLLNVYGFINFSRDVPDGKDVNRSFPGNTSGSLASRVASVVTRRVLPSIDIIMDFHAGGASRYNYPQVRYTKISTRSLDLARAFGARFVLQKPLISKSLRKVANSLSIPILVYEGGEALRYDKFAINAGYTGLVNVLRDRKMLPGKVIKPRKEQLLVTRSTWVRASTAGIFTWTKQSGDWVDKGEELGTIHDPFGVSLIRVKARRAGYIVGHNNAPVVHPGDALFNIGYEHQAL